MRPNESEPHEALGELYLDHHTDDDAQSELERAVALDSLAYARALSPRALVRAKTGRRKGAVLSTARFAPSTGFGGSQQFVGDRVRAPGTVCQCHPETREGSSSGPLRQCPLSVVFSVSEARPRRTRAESVGALARSSSKLSRT